MINKFFNWIKSLFGTTEPLKKLWTSYLEAKEEPVVLEETPAEEYNS